MDWKDVGKQLINVGVPILGTALGGPAGGLAAQAAVSLIGAKFGIDEEKVTPNAIANILGNPDNVLKLKEIELNHAFRIEELIIDDRKSAREREVGIAKATGSKDYFLYGLAGLIVIGFFVLTGILMWHKIPESSNEVVFLLFGGLIAGFERVCSYFLGTSKSSADKTRLMAGK